MLSRSLVIFLNSVYSHTWNTSLSKGVNDSSLEVFLCLCFLWISLFSLYDLVSFLYSGEFSQETVHSYLKVRHAHTQGQYQ